MGTKNTPGAFDCYDNALPDEPMFVLLARDPSAPELVRAWATRRHQAVSRGERPIDDMLMVDEAYRCARDMQAWRSANDGAWRKADEADADDERAQNYIRHGLREEDLP